MKSVIKLTDRVIINNIKAWYSEATEELISSGQSWYLEAQLFTQMLAIKYGIEPYIVATVVSCLSPNNKWERNKIDTISVIECYLRGGGENDVKVCTYSANKRKAFKALEGELIAESAPKTHAFAMNVGLLSSDHVTVDKWHLRACVTKPRESVTDCAESCTAVQYRRIERLTAKVAKEFGLKGYELQAIIWVTIKENWGR